MRESSFHAAGRKQDGAAATPARWLAGGLHPSSCKRARTDSASSPSADSYGSYHPGASVGAQRTTSRDTADRYRGSTASAYKAWLQSIDPKAGGQPAYASCIGARVAQQFNTDWGVVSCAASQPTRTESR